MRLNPFVLNTRNRLFNQPTLKSPYTPTLRIRSTMAMHGHSEVQ